MILMLTAQQQNWKRRALKPNQRLRTNYRENAFYLISSSAQRRGKREIGAIAWKSRGYAIFLYRSFVRSLISH